MLIDPPASKSTEVQFDRQSLRTGHLTEMAEDHRYFLGLNSISNSTPPFSFLAIHRGSTVHPRPSPDSVTQYLPL
jgi:hypothetical protein